MTLVVETGAIVENANSYSTEAEIVAYCAIYGVTVSTSDAESYVLRNRAFFDTQIYQGDQVDYVVQELSFPRDYVYLEGNLLANDAIPTLMKKAEQEGALLLAQGYDLQPTVTSASYVKEKQLGSMRKVYSDNKPDTNIYTRLNAFLGPLLESGGGGLHFTIDRSYG